jgi:transcriptional regulator with XRE-family HTH domain
MSQRELAEAVTAHVQRSTGRDVALDRHDISRWERGKRRVPTTDYRKALRAVLGVANDDELGFYVQVGDEPALTTAGMV